jgi:RNA polymerase sigma-70 factor (ECF subfamily)
MQFLKRNKPNDKFILSIHAHQGILHKICNLYAHSAADKEDLFQEMLMQLWKAFPSYKEDAKFTTWMYRVCLNTAISNLRKEKRRPLFSTLDKDIMDELPLEWTGTEANDELVHLYKAIEQLNEVEKAIIHLYLEENSYEEIAKIIGISVSNVGVKINRIKSKLETIIHPKQIK